MKRHLGLRDTRVFMTLILVSGLIFSSANYNTGYGQTPDNAALYKEHMKKGDAYRESKNYPAAMLEYEKASDLQPNEDEPRDKMQSIEATMGINELTELHKKMDQVRQQEQEQAASAKTGTAKPAEQSVAPFSGQEKDALRKSILDSFAEELRKAEKGSDMSVRAAVYRKIATAFKKVSDDEMVITYLSKALTIEQGLGKEKEVAAVYDDLADSYYNSGDFESSISSFEKSLSLKEKTGDKAGTSKVLSQIANVYETTYDYKNAIDYYQQSAKIKESIQDQSGLKDVENNLGDVYYKQKVLTSSIMSYEKAVDLIRKLNMNEALGSVYNKLGVAHYEMGNYEEAEKFFKESMKNLNENGNRKEASMALNNLGNLLFIHNDYEEAISYYERSLTTKKESDYSYGQAVTLFNLGNAYRRSGNQDMAIKSYEKSRRIADSLNIVSLKAKSTKALSVSYNAAKNFDKASEMEQELSSMNMTAISIEIPVSENEMDLHLNQTQKIISKLNEEALKRKEAIESGAENKMTDMYINNINSQYLKEQGRNRMLIIVLSAVATLLLGVLFLYFRSKKK
jgi:tetratricopeptide (TPR) repeat protein